MSDDEFAQVIALLRGGKRFRVYQGNDGEWGVDACDDGRFCVWAHIPYQDTPDRSITEAEVRGELGYIGFAGVLSRLS